MIVVQPIGKKSQTAVSTAGIAIVLDFSAAAGLSSPGATPPATKHLPPYVGFHVNIGRPMGAW